MAAADEQLAAAQSAAAFAAQKAPARAAVDHRTAQLEQQLMHAQEACRCTHRNPRKRLIDGVVCKCSWALQLALNTCVLFGFMHRYVEGCWHDGMGRLIKQLADARRHHRLSREFDVQIQWFLQQVCGGPLG